MASNQEPDENEYVDITTLEAVIGEDEYVDIDTVEDPENEYVDTVTVEDPENEYVDTVMVEAAEAATSIPWELDARFADSIHYPHMKTRPAPKPYVKLYPRDYTLFEVADTLHDFWGDIGAKKHEGAKEHLTALVQNLPTVTGTALVGANDSALAPCTDPLQTVQSCLHKDIKITTGNLEWDVTTVMESIYPHMKVEKETIRINEGNLAKWVTKSLDGTALNGMEDSECIIFKTEGPRKLVYKDGTGAKSEDRMINVPDHGEQSVRAALRRILLQHLTGNPDGPVYLTYDAAVGKITTKLTRDAPMVYTVITPQNIYDSATTSDDVAIGDNARYFFPTTHQYTPVAATVAATVDAFVSRRNAFSRPLYHAVYENHGFDVDNRYGFRYTIRDRELDTETASSSSSSAAAAAVDENKGVYSLAMTGSYQDGPSIPYVISLLDALGKGQANDMSVPELIQSLAKVEAKNKVIFPFMENAFKDEHRTMMTRFVQAMKDNKMGFFFDAKRCGDQDQADAARIAAEQYGRVVLVTGDILCAAFGRILGIHVILETAQKNPYKASVTYLYRSPILKGQVMSDKDIATLQAERRKKRADRLLPVINALDAIARLLADWRHVVVVKPNESDDNDDEDLSDQPDNPLTIPKSHLSKPRYELWELKRMDMDYQINTLLEVVEDWKGVKETEAEAEAEPESSSSSSSSSASATTYSEEFHAFLDQIYKGDKIWSPDTWVDFVDDMKGTRRNKMMSNYLKVSRQNILDLVSAKKDRLNLPSLERTRDSPEGLAMTINKDIAKFTGQWESYLDSITEPNIKEKLEPLGKLEPISLLSVTREGLIQAVDERNVILAAFEAELPKVLDSLSEDTHLASSSSSSAAAADSSSSSSSSAAAAAPESDSEQQGGLHEKRRLSNTNQTNVENSPKNRERKKPKQLESVWNEERHEAVVSVGAQLTHYLLDKCTADPVYGPALFYHGFSSVCRSHTPEAVSRLLPIQEQTIAGIRSRVGMFFYEWYKNGIQYHECKRRFPNALFLPQWEEYINKTKPLCIAWNKWNHTSQDKGKDKVKRPIDTLIAILEQAKGVPYPVLIPIQTLIQSQMASGIPFITQWYNDIMKFTDDMPRLADVYFQRILISSDETIPLALQDDDDETETHPPYSPQKPIEDSKEDATMEDFEDCKEDASHPLMCVEKDLRTMSLNASAANIDRYLTLLLLSRDPKDRLRVMVVFPRLAIHFRNVNDSFLATLYQDDALPSLKTWDNIISWIYNWAPSQSGPVNKMEQVQPDEAESKEEHKPIPVYGGTRKIKGKSRMYTKGRGRKVQKKPTNHKKPKKQTAAKSFKASCKRSASILKKTRSRR